jgi:DNA-binding NarL/FixJ family response regulator
LQASTGLLPSKGAICAGLYAAGIGEFKTRTSGRFVVMKIMIVENSRIMREVLRVLLSDIAGISVTGEFCCAPTAVAGMLRAPPDVLLLDIDLKVGNGMDVLRVASAQAPAIKVIMVTNHGDQIYRTHCIDAGAYAFYDKSHELDALRRSMRCLADFETNPASARP